MALTAGQFVPDPAVASGNDTPQPLAECRDGSMSVVRTPPDSVAQSFSFAGDPDKFGIEYVVTLSGPCADAVEEAEQSLVRLADGSVYHLEGGKLRPWPKGEGAFVAEDLEANEIPSFGGRRFVAADKYLSIRTDEGMEYRYVGLWSDGNRWTVATFVTPGTGEAARTRCLLFHSTLPLRGITFFPSPDTPSGQIWTVQEGPSKEIRVVAMSWWHESVSMEGTAPDPCDASPSGSGNPGGAGATKTSEEAARQRAANDIARAVMEAAGMTPLPAPPGGYSTEEPLRFSVPGEEDDSRETAAPD